MPTFLVIGAAKSGTTSLLEYLKQHPEIYASAIKEPRFFSFEGVTLDFRGPGDEVENRTTITSLEAYQELFAEVSTEKAIGEASPPYMYVPGTSSRIAHHVPDVKLIAILRHPADRAYSNYVEKRTRGLEPIDDFARALDEESRRIADNWSFTWHYVQRGFYHRQLEPFYGTFPREQIRVFLFEELQADPGAVMREIYRFLGVDEAYSPAVGVKYRVSGEAKSKRIQRAVRGDNLIKAAVKKVLPSSVRSSVKARMLAMNTIPQRIPAEDRERLVGIYRTDIEKLQGLLDRDLSSWLAAEPERPHDDDVPGHHN